MKVDIYNIIEEAKQSKMFSKEELKSFFSPVGIGYLTSKINLDEDKTNLEKTCEEILKAKENFWLSIKKENVEDFSCELFKHLKKIFNNKKDFEKTIRKIKHSIKKKIENSYEPLQKTNEQTATGILFKLFLKEYNTKYAFTWRGFKRVKKEYEKSHFLDGENIYSLKAMLEKDENIKSVNDFTMFSKSNHTLSDYTLNKLQEKALS